MIESHISTLLHMHVVKHIVSAERIFVCNCVQWQVTVVIIAQCDQVC
jgi:hypothetical protein